jgi:hypothetical protein
MTMSKQKMSPRRARAQEARLSYDRALNTPPRKRKLGPVSREHPALKALRASLARATEPALRARIERAISSLTKEIAS